MFLKLTLLHILLIEPISSVSVKEFAKNFLDYRNEIDLIQVDFFVIQNLTLEEADLNEKWKDLKKFKFSEELILLKDKPTSLINFDNSYIIKDPSPNILSIELPTNDIQQERNQSVLPKPEPFLFERLPFQNETLKIQNNLNRSKDYRVLFYNSWIQPAASKAKSAPIYIEASKKDKKVYGEIQIYKERFLHLNTRLRLSQKTEKVTNSHEKPQIVDFQNFLNVQEKVEPEIEANLNYWIETIFNSVKVNFSYLSDLMGYGGKLSSDPLIVSPEYFYQDLFEISKGIKISSEEFNFIDHPHFSVLVRIKEI